MKLSNLCDDDLRKVSLLKTRRGVATSEAKRAQQILYTRHCTHGGYFASKIGKLTSSQSNLDRNLTREYVTFEEANGCTLEQYLEKEHSRRSGSNEVSSDL